MPENPLDDMEIHIPYIPCTDPVADMVLRLKELEKLNIARNWKLSDEEEQVRKEHLVTLGISEHDPLEELLIVGERLHRLLVDPPLPPTYPTKKEFNNRFETLLNESRGSKRFWGRLFNFRPRPIPFLPETVLASDLANHARADWEYLQARGPETLEKYLYKMGIGMSHEFSYRARVGTDRPIIVMRDWTLVDGRHRSAVLRILREDYVLERGMNDWIKVRKAK